MSFAHLEFSRPWLGLLILLILLVWLLRKHLSGTKAAVIFSDLRLISSEGTWRTRTLFLPDLIYFTGWLCMIIALMGPRLGHEETKVTTEGIAISMVMDVSSSMREKDMPLEGQVINRYEMVRKVFKDFVQGREESELKGRNNDMLSLVVFGSYVDDLCPLTLDHDFLLDLMENFIDSVQTDFVKTNEEFQRTGRQPSHAPIWASTCIYEGVAMGAEMLHSPKQQLDVAKENAQSNYNIKSKVLILLTDGEDTGSEITIEDSIEVAKEFGVKVYAIAIHGKELQQNIRGLIFKRGSREYDDSPMKKLAKETGGRFFKATDPDSLLKIYQTIDELETTEISRQVSMDFAPWHRPWVLACFICLLLHKLLKESVYRELP